jgi:hypothetical protein
VIETFQGTQLLLVSAALITACLSKLASPDSRPRTVYGDTAPTPAFVVRDSRAMAVGLALSEGALGVALLVTSHPSVRVVTIMGFTSATWVVSELRTHRPEDGCGCFGALSAGRIGLRCVTRTALFTAAAIVTLSVPHTGIDVLRASLGWGGVMLVAEILIFIALSPEINVLLSRLRSPVPCELRTAPLSDTHDVLQASNAWQEHEDLLVSRTPIDVWRELCWRLLAYQGRVAGQEVEIVFAVSMNERHPIVLSAILGTTDPEGSAIKVSTMGIPSPGTSATGISSPPVSNPAISNPDFSHAGTSRAATSGAGTSGAGTPSTGASSAGRPVALSSAAGETQETTGEGRQDHVPQGGRDEDTDPGGGGGEHAAGEDTGPPPLAAVPART